jgi:SPP1 family predicted phage head-tail adaptor
MNPGLLRHTVTIQQRAAGTDASGAANGDWTDFATVHAAIWPLRGKELYAAQQYVSQVDSRIRIRYHAGITPQMRVVWQGRIFEIVYVVDPELRHITLDLMCREIREGC